MSETPEVSVPKPKVTDYGRENFAIEVAFNTLLTQATQQGLRIQPVMGLMYLPDQKLTRDFQKACRAIFSALRPV